MQMSSAMEADVREDLGDLLARPAVAAERVLRPHAAELGALELGDRLAAGERLGHELAVVAGEDGLVVETLRCDGPPAM